MLEKGFSAFGADIEFDVDAGAEIVLTLIKCLVLGVVRTAHSRRGRVVRSVMVPTRRPIIRIRVTGWTLFDLLAALNGTKLLVQVERKFEYIMCIGCGIHVARVRHHRANSATMASYCWVCLDNHDHATS